LTGERGCRPFFQALKSVIRDWADHDIDSAGMPIAR
jgi:hypothetical protein